LAVSSWEVEVREGGMTLRVFEFLYPHGQTHGPLNTVLPLTFSL